LKIYTRTGDGGETSLWGIAGEKRIAKDSARVEAYGCVDEANAWLGMARTALDDPDVDSVLSDVQHRLFALGSDLSTLNARRQHHLTDADVAALEAAIDRYDAELEPLVRFVIPGGTPGAAALHGARTVVRRAERRVISLYRAEPGPTIHVRYLNRLSDLLFTMARVANARHGRGDVPAEF
jgi:cob(I)alamin adenosyltransferase